MSIAPQLRTSMWPVGSNGRVPIRAGDLAAAWKTFIGRIPWHWLVTLTFDPKKRFPVNRDLASRQALDWCRGIERDLRGPCGWVYATERGRSGLWHAHVLLTKFDDEVLDLSCRSWQWRNGRPQVQEVFDRGGAVLYISKEAAASGEVVACDTLRRYAHCLRSEVIMQLHPDSPSAV